MKAYVVCTLAAVLVAVAGVQLALILTASAVLAGVGFLTVLTGRRLMARGVSLHVIADLGPRQAVTA